MPGGDGTGPFGNGAETGWGRGPCRGLQRKGFGRGRNDRGEGRGGGRGRRNRFWAGGTQGWMRGRTTQPPDAGMEATVEPEREWLEQRSAVLRTEQRQIRDRLAELKGERAD